MNALSFFYFIKPYIMSGEEIFLATGSAIGGAITWMFASNQKLKEGISDFMLKSLNKTKLNKIPLTSHKLFGSLSQRQSSLSTFIIDDPVKMHFYMTYVNIAFRRIEIAANQIIEAQASGKPVEQEIMGIVYEMEAKINLHIDKKLNIPDKVKASFDKWRAMLTSAFNESIREIAHDDLFNNDYFLTYRLLDVFAFYVTALLHTGAVEMARLNGSFKGLTLEDLQKKE